MAWICHSLRNAQTAWGVNVVALFSSSLSSKVWELDEELHIVGNNTKTLSIQNDQVSQSLRWGRSAVVFSVPSIRCIT